MQPVNRTALRPAIWIGFLGGWILSGVLVATRLGGAPVAALGFCTGFAIVGGAVYERRQRLRNWAIPEDEEPGPWDGMAWEGWLMLAGQVMFGILFIRVLAAVPWSSEWTELFWRIRP